MLSSSASRHKYFAGSEIIWITPAFFALNKPVQRLNRKFTYMMPHHYSIQKRNSLIWLVFYLGVLLPAIFLSAGCKRADIAYYEIPKEEVRPAQTEESEDHSHIDRPVMPPAGMPLASIDWTLPEEWEDDGPHPIRIGSFHVHGENDDKAEILVMRFSGDAGRDLDFVNFVARELQLPDFTMENIDDAAEHVMLAEKDFLIVDLASENPTQDKTNAQRTIAATLSRDGYSWFFKMTGYEPLVGKQKEPFLAFLESVKFRPANNQPVSGSK